MNKSTNQPDEHDNRRDAVLRTMLKTPPKPHAKATPGGADSEAAPAPRQKKGRDA